jgi:Kef-type K+ transport system membrane component KefB
MRTANQCGAPLTVLAEPAASSGGYRLRWAAEWTRERFWVIPAVLLALGTGLAVLVAGGLITVALSLGTVAALAATGFVRDYVPVALALTTTALGTLLPILHDSGMLAGDFGRYVFAAGAVGELFIPVFCVSSGMTLDIGGIARNPARVIAFFLLLLVIRGLPSMLVYRKVLPLRQRAEMTFITATALPLLVALAEIGLRDGRMLPANAAALVGAGVLSVLVFPAVAMALAGKGGGLGAPLAAEPAPEAPHPADRLLPPWHR